MAAYSTKLTSLLMLCYLHAACSAVRLRNLRHASVDCRGGLFISARTGYTALGVSGEPGSQPLGQCTEYGQKANPLLRFYRSFDLCGVKLARNDHHSSKTDTYSAYVWLGRVLRDGEGLMVRWETKERVDCPLDPEPPLILREASVEQHPRNGGPMRYNLKVDVSSVQGLPHVKFCEAYDLDNDSFPVLNGNCVLSGEKMRLSYDQQILRIEHRSVTSIRSYACRIIVKPHPQTLTTCNASEFERQSVLVHEDGLYDRGISVFCSASPNASGQRSTWPLCTPSQFSLASGEAPYVPAQSFISQSGSIRYFPVSDCDSLYVSLLFICGVAVLSFLVGLAVPAVVSKLPSPKRRRNPTVAGGSGRGTCRCGWLPVPNRQG